MADTAFDIWEHFERGPGYNGTYNLTCNYCKHPTAISTAAKDALNSKDADKHKRQGEKHQRAQLDERRYKSRRRDSTFAGRSRQDIRDAFQRCDAQGVHDALADFFFGEGIPFRVVESRRFKRLCSDISRCPGYKPPCRKALRGNLL